MSDAKITPRMAGPEHMVLNVLIRRETHPCRYEPCEQCPWRKDQVGNFPPEPFRVSAHTAYDAAVPMFGCHMSKPASPLTCAGFLLSAGALHNIGVRLGLTRGLALDKVTSSVPLFSSYREMAIANGVAPDDFVLARCRDR